MYGVKVIKNQEVPVISPVLGDPHISYWCNAFLECNNRYNKDD